MVSGSSVDQLHHEERLPARRQAAVEHLGDVGVIHQRQGLPFLLEPLQDGPGIHAGLDQFESDLALDRLGLLGDPDLSHPSFADLLLQRIPPRDHRPDLTRRRITCRRPGPGAGHWLGRLQTSRDPIRSEARFQVFGFIQFARGAIQKTAGRLMDRQQGKNGLAQLRLAGARLVKVRRPLDGVSLRQSFVKQNFFGHGSPSRQVRFATTSQCGEILISASEKFFHSGNSCV